MQIFFVTHCSLLGDESFTLASVLLLVEQILVDLDLVELLVDGCQPTMYCGMYLSMAACLIPTWRSKRARLSAENLHFS
jgi:hypothetical protein